MPLTPDAKAEIAEAIRIVKEDKLWARLSRMEKGMTTPTPPTPPVPPTPPGPNPPPPVPPTPPNDPPKTGKSAYWGELLSDD